MSELNPYHIVYKPRLSRSSKWRVWCELSNSGMRSRALPRLAFIHRRRLVFGTHEHGSSDHVKEYALPDQPGGAANSVARSIFDSVDVPPTRTPGK